MANFRAPVPHPGTRLKRLFDEKDVPVHKAAALLGVGRQALSKLLNGKADLTKEMAARIGKAFSDADAQMLLAMQTALDEERGAEQAKEIATRTYVGPFMGIHARQIAAWAEQISARQQLPALLRRLVHATGSLLTTVDFPAYDNAQRHGWDGFVVTDNATPWIPRGQSGWEFGCDAKPAQKAEEDYAARSYARTTAAKKGDNAGDGEKKDQAAGAAQNDLTAEDRKNIIFVFVTPRNWPGKDAWAKTKRAEGIWKDVVVHDAGILEQWLEESIPTQSWFGEILGNGAEGTATMDACWKDFADSCKPHLSKLLFKNTVASSKSKLETWLHQPPTSAFVVTAVSISEGLAFVSCALEAAGPMPGTYYDRAILLRTPEALRRTVKAAPDFVAVVADADVELASAGVQETHHLLVVRLHNSISGEPDIALDLVDDQSFREALSDMGLPDEDYHRYCRETACSPTLLRRRFSQLPAIREPSWSHDPQLGQSLVPLMLPGVWGADVTGDREILSALARAKYDEIEATVAHLLAVPETPLWSIGKFRGVTSKIDVLFGAAKFVTTKHLDDFFFVAEVVLSEEDPALDLPPEEQWLANIKGKNREYTSSLRNGICETLVMLAVHGDYLFDARLGPQYLTHRVDKLVERLLTPLDGRTWSSHRSDLPRYAEAAPDVFLKVLKADLDSPAPKVHALLAPMDSGVFGGGCNRTGLLWALETLAWKPEQLLPVSRLLARMGEVEINDNWVNKPEASLEAIFRGWMPQTAATIQQRNIVMETICREYPEVGWRLITAQFGNHQGFGSYSARPHWRNDAAGAGQTAKTWGEIWAVADKARELAITWPHHNARTLGDLVERLSDIKPEDQERVWTAVKDWTDGNNDENAAHMLRERIRKSAFTRRARIHNRVTETVRDRAREAYDRLEPNDVIVRHRWLFDTQWVDESSDELEDDKLDYDVRAKRVETLRKKALLEIRETLGFAGLMRLIEVTGAEWAVGMLLADITAETDRPAFLEKIARQASPPDDTKLLIVTDGFIAKMPTLERNLVLAQLLTKFAQVGEEKAALRLLGAAPFKAETWTLLDLLPAAWSEAYWQAVNPRWDRQDEAENNFLTDKLIEAGRPRGAFFVLHMDFNKVESRRLAALLRAVATDNRDGKRQPLARHELSEAFKSLKARSRTEVSETELAQLEFIYADALDHTEYGLPTLEEQIGSDPNLFMHLIALVYRRKDGTEPDRPEWAIADQRTREGTAATAYSVLHKLTRLPGTGSDGTLDPQALMRWVRQTRELADKYGRLKSADHAIGELFGRAPAGKDGIWPCEPVRQAFDAVGSDSMAEGFHMGRYNVRGVHWRGEGGSDERTMAAQYRGWAKAIAFAYPFMAKALEDLAETYAREAAMHDTDASIRRRLSQ